MNDDSLFDVFESEDEVQPGDPFAFSCRGCGQHCCSNTALFLMPPEAMRILWHLERNPAMAERLQARGVRWGDLSIGHSTGLPTLQMIMQPTPNSREEPRCPFLASVHRTVGDQSIDTGMNWCSLHGARPVACRTYPLGMLSVDGEVTSYAVTMRCPGFEKPSADDALPPDYAPPDPMQTVADWINAQIDQGQMDECQHYVNSVTAAYLEANCHATTDDNPGGSLNDDQVIRLGAEYFYRPIPAPADPAEDHATLMAWLDELVRALPMIRRGLGK